MCDVPSMAVFSCMESIQCCPGIVSRYFCKLLLTIPVAPMMMMMIIIIIFIIPVVRTLNLRRETKTVFIFFLPFLSSSVMER
jgi:hypothetical protein